MSDRTGPESGARRPPFSRPVPPKDLAALKRPKDFAEKASADEREAIREALDLERVTAVRFDARLSPDDEADWRLEGRVFARVAQRCVVTLEAVPAEIDAPFLRLWSEDAQDEALALDDGAAAGAGRLAEQDFAELADMGETEFDLQDPIVEPTPETIDLGEIAIETLRLALDPYPRAPGALFDGVVAGPPGAEPLTDEAARPFGGLAALKAQMESDKSDEDG